MELLGEAGHRAVAVDLPHHGRAERPTAEGFFAVVDDFVAAAVCQFDFGDGVLLVGNSVGGLAALHVAQRPGLPLAGVLAIAPAGTHTPRWLTALHRTSAVVAPVVSAATKPMIRGTAMGPALIAAAFSAALAHGTLSPTAKAQYASHWGPGDLRRQLLLGGTMIAELDGPEVLSAEPFVVPVTVGWGDRDEACSARGTRFLRAAHPEIGIAVLRCAGHCPQYECPDIVAKIIADIVATASTARLRRTAP
jgi:pimeloyl-ACP methyl ester carboxylesterase